MPPTTTVISDPPSNPKAYEVSLIEMVREHGWQSTSVGADNNGDPAFSYTTGFWFTADQPEIVVFDFSPQLAHNVFAQIMTKMRAGDQLRVCHPIEGVLTNETIYLFPVRRDVGVSYLRSSNWFYRKTDFPIVQLVWADSSGRFPWEPDFDEALAALQPDLSERGWMNELEKASDGS